jgi:hypothetical protein
LILSVLPIRRFVEKWAHLCAHLYHSYPSLTSIAVQLIYLGTRVLMWRFSSVAPFPFLLQRRTGTYSALCLCRTPGFCCLFFAELVISGPELSGQATKSKKTAGILFCSTNCRVCKAPSPPIGRSLQSSFTQYAKFWFLDAIAGPIPAAFFSIGPRIPCEHQGPRGAIITPSER